MAVVGHRLSLLFCTRLPHSFLTDFLPPPLPRSCLYFNIILSHPSSDLLVFKPLYLKSVNGMLAPGAAGESWKSACESMCGFR